MSGPVAFQRQLKAVEDLISGRPNWQGLEEAFAPAQVSDRFRPEDDLAKMMAAFSRTAEGQRMFEWIFELTKWAPYPKTGNSFESAALAAAKHEARVAVGDVIFAAIGAGDELLNPKEPAT